MQTQQNFNVEISQDFPVSVEQLYAAWTQPEQLKQWWKPMNNHLTDVTNDLKKGGTVKYVFEDKLVISGEYEEVKENELLVYTWNWELAEDAVKNANYKLHVAFENSGSGSSIKVTQDNFENEEGTLPHKEGWNKGLKDLEQYLSGSGSNGSKQDYSGAAGTYQPESVESDRSGGYNESPEQVKVGGG